MRIQAYSLITLISGLLCLGQGLFVLCKNHRQRTNFLYFLFCLASSVWLFSITLLASKHFSYEISMVLGRSVYSGVVFMPTFALHFVISFLATDLERKVGRDLITAYFLTVLFLLLVWTNNNFISGVYNYSWGYYPKGGPIHLIHTFFVMATAFYSIFLLRRGMNIVLLREGKSNRYYEIRSFLFALIFVTCGATDFIHNWGIDFFPIGCIFVALFVTFSSYAIFKFESLGITVVVKKSIIYSILVSILTATYFLCIYLLSSFLGDFQQAHGMLPFILTLVTLVSLPLERKIQQKIDRLFFVKSRESIERENVLLLQEIQKQERNKAIATLAAGMAHEIKNPLTSIRTFAEYLPAKYDDPHFRQKFSRIVMDEVDRVNNIIKQLLDFSKPQELNISNIHICDVIDETLELLANNVVRQNIEVSKNYDINTLVPGDKNQLKQAILNIILNAIQAMPVGGQLHIDATTKGGIYEISVKDSGVGIAKEDLKRIGDPFFSTKENGTGLGLAIVQVIVEKHGGKIRFDSELGHGTTVSVFLKSRN